jgi:hypothetical protein
MSTSGEQPRQDGELPPTAETRDRTVLGLLLSDPTHSLWSIGEIAQALSGRGEAIESVGWLAEVGLVHRIGEFAWPSLAARSAEKLSV